MNYIFKQIDNISGRFAETTVDFNADSLTEVLDQFELFLRGSGFYFTGKLDFVNDDDCGPEWHNEEFDTPQEEPSATWPFPKQTSTQEEWNGVAPSVAMQWTANELMKGPMTVQSITEKCSICGISLESMKNQKCWDIKCPIGNNAN
jgi:hypothetical protein